MWPVDPGVKGFIPPEIIGLLNKLSAHSAFVLSIPYWC
jgi:hypothetical protein